MRYVAVSAITLIFGMSLIVLGVPRTIGAFVALPSGPILNKIQFQKPVQQNELETLIESQEGSLAWGETGRKWTDLGLAQLLMAEQTVSEPSVRQGHIEDAIVSLKKGLSLAPANAFAWTRLAYVEIKKAGPSQAAASALRMSFATAPYEPSLLRVRLELCFLTWQHFGPKDREVFFKQIRAWWNSERFNSEADAKWKGYKKWHQKQVDKTRDELVRLAVRLDRANVVRAALLKTSAELSEFERRLRKHFK